MPLKVFYPTAAVPLSSIHVSVSTCTHTWPHSDLPGVAAIVHPLQDESGESSKGLLEAEETMVSFIQSTRF